MNLEQPSTEFSKVLTPKSNMSKAKLKPLDNLD